MKNLNLLISAFILIVFVCIHELVFNKGDVNLNRIASQIECNTENNSVTISLDDGQRVYIVFHENKSLQNALLYPKGNERTVPASIMDDLGKYQPLIQLARDCLFN